MAWPVCCALLLAGAGTLGAQKLIVGAAPGVPDSVSAADRAVLESKSASRTLACAVTPTKPELGFDLKFHAGYGVDVPLKELAGDSNQLTTIFRVIAEGHASDAAYFKKHVRVPSLDDADRGAVSLAGAFDVGAGKYHIDWLIRDRSGRVCSFHWDAEAALGPRDRQIALNIAAGAVRQSVTEPFLPAPDVERHRGGAPLHVKAIVNFAPQDAAAATLQPVEVGALLSILRAIACDPRVARFSLIAFNLQEQKVLYRQSDAPKIDFPALGRALRSLNLGTTDIERLGQKHEGTQFLAGLIAAEVSRPAGNPDAVIFVGPRLSNTDAIPAGALKQIGGLRFPVFYMSYNLSPVATPWRDTISGAVKYLKGMEFPINRPRDVFYAWSEIVSRAGKSKSRVTVAGNAPSQ